MLLLLVFVCVHQKIPVQDLVYLRIRHGHEFLVGVLAYRLSPHRTLADLSAPARVYEVPPVDAVGYEPRAAGARELCRGGRYVSGPAAEGSVAFGHHAYVLPERKTALYLANGIDRGCAFLSCYWINKEYYEPAYKAASEDVFARNEIHVPSERGTEVQKVPVRVVVSQYEACLGPGRIALVAVFSAYREPDPYDGPQKSRACARCIRAFPMVRHRYLRRPSG